MEFAFKISSPVGMQHSYGSFHVYLFIELNLFFIGKMLCYIISGLGYSIYTFGFF